MNPRERRPFDDADERVLISRARGHYPAEHILPTRCITCGKPYPCQRAEPLDPPVDLGTRYWIAAPIIGLILLTIVFVVLGR